MKTFILTILGASIAQIITWLFVRGFEESYYGRQAREEISRWFDNTSKHMKKKNIHKNFKV